MPGYILALDQGTTSSRAILFDDRQNFTFAGRAVDYGYLQKNCPDQQIFLETSKKCHRSECMR